MKSGSAPPGAPLVSMMACFARMHVLRRWPTAGSARDLPIGPSRGPDGESLSVVSQSRATSDSRGRIRANRGTARATSQRAMAEDPNAAWRAVVSHPLEHEHYRPLSSAAVLEIAGSSVCGAMHSHNTDHYLALRVGRMQETVMSSLTESDLPPRFTEYGYALAVADGFGDRGVGARASRVALSTLAFLTIR